MDLPGAPSPRQREEPAGCRSHREEPLEALSLHKQAGSQDQHWPRGSLVGLTLPARPSVAFGSSTSRREEPSVAYMLHLQLGQTLAGRQLCRPYLSFSMGTVGLRLSGALPARQSVAHGDCTSHRKSPRVANPLHLQVGRQRPPWLRGSVLGLTYLLVQEL